MSLKIDRLQLEIIINNDQARKQMRVLEEEFVTLKKEQKKFTSDSNEWKQLDNQIKSNRQQWDTVINSIGTANMTLKELANRSKELTLMKQHLRPGTDAYQQLDTELKSVNARMGELKGKSVNSGSAISEMKGAFSSTLSTVMSFAGGMGVAFSAVGAVKKIISATDIVSDKWNETIGGVTTGLSYLARSIATLDFSNFLTNMSNAIEAGKEYVKTLDKIEDRTRALSIIEAKDRERLADLQIVLRSVTNEKSVRIAAGKEILDIEQKNAERRKSLANDAMQAELKRASVLTGLSKERITQILVEQETNRKLVDQANEYNDALDRQRIANVGASGASMYGQTSAPSIDKTTLDIIKNAPQAVKSYATELQKFGKLNEEEYNKITHSIQAVGDANAAFSETTARTQVRLSKLNAGILEDNETEASKKKKQTEALKTSYDLLNEKVAKLKDTQLEYIKTGDKRLDQITKEIIAGEKLIQVYKDTQEALNSGIDLKAAIPVISAKGFGKIESKPEVAKSVDSKTLGILTKQADKNSASISESNFSADNKAAGKSSEGMSPGDIKDIELAAATTLNSTLFNIVKGRQEAEFNHKMSLIDKERDRELSNKHLTEAQKQAINDKYDKKIKAAKQESWKKQRNADAVSATIAGILATIKAGPTTPAGIITAIAAAAGVVEILAQKVPEFAGGRYSVTGESGRQYTADYTGRARTALYTRPALVAETGAEIIIDPATTKNLQMNYPEVIDAINFARVRQFASGRYKQTSGSPAGNSSNTGSGSSGALQQMSDFTAAVDKFNVTVEKLQQDGIKCDFSLFDFEKIQAQKVSIESQTTI